MENSNPTFSTKILDYLKVAAHWAMFTAVVIGARMFFTVYYVYNYTKSLSRETISEKFAVSYLTNSAVDIILSLFTVYFLYRFAQHAYQAVKNNQPREWEGVFGQFRNYLIISVVLTLNWMLYSVVNLFSIW